MTIVVPSLEHIEQAVGLLRRGELVALPTETVYGLGADALNPDAVARIFAAKGRPADHPLIVHLPDAEHLTHWAAAVPREAIALARAFWPGPLTLILRRDPMVPDAVTGGQDTVGLRVPAHPVALALLKAFDSGIAAPSANRFGRISPTSARHVEAELGERVAMILDGGACEVGIESTILDFSRGTPEILRPGAISPDAIARVIGRHPSVRTTAEPPDEKPAGGVRSAQGGEPSGGFIGNRQALDALDASASVAQPVPRVSGALAAHYAPLTPLELVEADALLAEALDRAAVGIRVAVLSHSCDDPQNERLVWQVMPADPVAYARTLYAALRELDDIGADCILVEKPPMADDWQAIADRLGRAAVGSG